jgi:hypothetical protein
MKKLLLCLLFTTALSLTLYAQDTTLVKNQANMVAKAMIAGDYKTLVNYMYPKAVQMGGGKEKMIALVTNGMQQMKTQGITFESVKVDAPGKFYKAGTEIHCLLPETIILQLPNARIASHSSMLGISGDGGKSWSFLDMNNASVEKIKEILPNFNPELQIPKATTERLD